MSAYRLHPRLTPGRRAWMERLRARGSAKRSRGPVGYQCMTLGWTQWVFRKGDQARPQAEVIAEFGSWGAAIEAGWMASDLEMLTEDGRAILEETR
jgi:hypothetical protein